MNNKLLTYLPLTIIVLIGIFFRLVSLNQNPPGLTNDEVNIVMNAQSLLKTGKNIPGIVTGITGSNSGDLYAGIHSEFSSYYIIPFIYFFGFNLVSIKLAFVFASLGIIVVGYLLAKELFNDRVAVISSFLLAINPWLIFYGRSAYESILSSFFLLFGDLLNNQIKWMA